MTIDISDLCNLKTMSYLPYQLRGLGLRILRKLNKNQDNRWKQFLISAIVSVNEIINMDKTCVTEANKEWSKYPWNSKQKTISAILLKRVIFLLNRSRERTHGEARLFDAEGKIRRQISDRSSLEYIDMEFNTYLQQMKDRFIETFGGDEKYIIILFSHYIPCTEPGHMCSRLLGEFSTQFNEQLIVAYMDVFKNTSCKDSLKFIKDNNNNCCFSLRDFTKDQRDTFKIEYEYVDIQINTATSIQKLSYEEDDYISRRMKRRRKYKTRYKKIKSGPRERKKEFVRDSFKLNFTMFNYDEKIYDDSFCV
ncbi:unnamed protein product [Mytilus coruscus]|uniref:Uncharacterized protein n=1 Tax=Mytilus coruscus TaxID=42192 RepID=A0A6J8C441_MYTCO|nr:unnamed protein product [Mytilus coruscus]